MGLFSKKKCDICGEEIKLLSGKKLANGNICKECRKRLSLWFDDYGASSVDDIKNQINAREKNKSQLENFKTTCAYGEFSCVLIDVEAKKFVALPTTSDTFFGNSKIITSIDEIKDKNPDIIDFSQVTQVDFKPKVTAREIKKNENGIQVSYDPRHFEYMCNFQINMKLEHPYIKSMSLTLNDAAIVIPCDEPRRVTTYSDEIKAALLGIKKRDFGIENNADYKEVNSIKDLIFNQMNDIPDYSFGFKVDRHRNWKKIQEYQYYLTICEQIKKIIEDK